MFNKENVKLMLSVPWSEYTKNLKLDNTATAVTYKNDKPADDGMLIEERERIFVIVPISIPGMGKSFFVEKVLINYCKSNGMELNIVSADKIRRNAMDALAKRQKGLSQDQLFERTGKEANKFFMDSVEAKLRINTKANSILFIDRNHPPNGIEKILSHIRKVTPAKFKPEIIALLPQGTPGTEFGFVNAKGDNISYPFSLNFFLKCLERVQSRKGHETLNGEGSKSLNVMLMFLNLYRNSNLGHEFLRNYGFDNCLSMEFIKEAQLFELPGHFRASLGKAFDSMRVGGNCDQKWLLDGLTLDIEKIFAVNSGSSSKSYPSYLELEEQFKSFFSKYDSGSEATQNTTLDRTNS